MDGKLVILIAITLQAGNANMDPCEVHKNITDVDLLTNHTYKEGQACNYTPSAIAPAWYRYVGTPVGAMATSCPGKTACGGREQIWINDTLPNYADGISSVDTCVSTANKCCEIKTWILMKNCNSFYVVQLRKPPKCFTHYCFDSSIITKLETVLTTQSTSTTTTEVTTSSTPSTTIHTASTTKSTSIQTTTPNTSTISSILSTQKTSHPTILTSSAKITTTETTTASITYLSYSSTPLISLVTATHTTFVSNENDKDKGKTTALAAGFGTTGVVFIVASMFAALFVRNRKMRIKKNPEKEDTMKKPKFNAASFKNTANLSEQEVTITFERDYD